MRASAARSTIIFVLLCFEFGRAFQLGQYGRVHSASFTNPTLCPKQSQITENKSFLLFGGTSVGDGVKQNLEVTIRLRKLILALWRLFSFPLRFMRRLPSNSTEESQASLLEKVDAIDEETVHNEIDPDNKFVATATTSLIQGKESDDDSSIILKTSSFVEDGASSAAESVSAIGTAAQHDIANIKDAAAPLTNAIKTMLAPKKEEQKPVIAVDQETVSEKPTFTIKPKAGGRWATAAIDNSGDWQLIDTEDFKKDYDEYLKLLGQPKIVRVVALGLVGLTAEYTEQTKEGRELLIRGKSGINVWERRLISSGADAENDDYKPECVTIRTADDEAVQAEAWWENNGTVHISWLRGVEKYGGGDFESKRYLEDGGNSMVCESIFHPKQEGRREARLTWKFLRK